VNTAEAIAHVEGGGRATCDALPTGAVLKTEPRGWAQSRPRVIWEGTGDGFDLTPRLCDLAEGMEWRKVEGWAAYAN